MLSLSATDSEGRGSRPAPYDPTNQTFMMGPCQRVDLHHLVARTGTRTTYQPTRLAQRSANPASALQRVSPPEAVPTAVLTESSTVQEHASPTAIKPMAEPQASCHPTRLPHQPDHSASDPQPVSVQEAVPTAVLTGSSTVRKHIDITATEPVVTGSMARSARPTTLGAAALAKINSSIRHKLRLVEMAARVPASARPEWWFGDTATTIIDADSAVHGGQLEAAAEARQRRPNPPPRRAQEQPWQDGVGKSSSESQQLQPQAVCANRAGSGESQQPQPPPVGGRRAVCATRAPPTAEPAQLAAAPNEEPPKPPPTPSMTRRQTRSQTRLAAFLRRKRLKFWAASILRMVRMRDQRAWDLDAMPASGPTRC